MASIKLRRGSGVPSGLTFGEPAFDITNSRLYVGITGGSALVGVAGGGVHSFNGLTGAVTGVTTGSENTFGPLQSFTNGISSAGGTFSSQARFTSGISASGGATFASDVAVNGGSLTTTATTGNLFNTTATTLNIGGAATTTNIANFAGGLTLNIATGTNAASVKNINIGTGNIGGGSTRLTISGGSGLIESGSNGITMGSISGGVISSLSRFVASSGICSGANINLYGAQPIIASAGTSNIIIAPGSGTLGVSGGVCAGAFILTSSGIKALTGTTYTFLDSDNGDILTHDNASGCTFTIPTGLPVGYSTTVIRLNASGRVSFIAAAGATMNTFGGFTALAGQHASASLISYASNIYNLSGNLI